MTITRDVIQDLLPVYTSGEASADTKALVEEFLANDQELRTLVESARAADIPCLPEPEHLESMELKSLAKTRRLLAWKTWLAAGSVLFSTSPLLFIWRDGRIVFMAREQPVLSAVFLLLGLIGWTAFFRVCRSLMAAGLEPPYTMLARVPLVLMSNLLALSMIEVLKSWIGEQRWMALLFPVFLGLALWLGQRWRVIPTIEQVERPTSLFNGDNNPRDKRRD